MCRDAYYQEISIHYFSWNFALLNLEFWPYIKYSIEQFVITSSYTVAQNIVKLCRCAIYMEIPVSLFNWEFSSVWNIEFWPYIEYCFKQLVSTTRLKHGI